MTEKRSWCAGSLPTEVTELIGDLFSEDQRTEGRPTLKPGQTALARQWLERTLIDSLARWEHIEELRGRYRGTFHQPIARRDWPDEGRPAGPRPDPAFRHYEVWPEERAQAVAERGLGELADDEVARLLLNPFALWDVADVIDATQPDVWAPAMMSLGQEMLRVAGE